MKRLNIAQVAKAARVSTTTVSRVINKIPTVTEGNRQRVQEAIKRLQYHPNPNAQRLASGQANPTVAVIIPRFEGIFHSYYAMQVIQGIGMAAERVRCDLLLHVTNGGSLGVGAVDGVIFVDLVGCEELLDRTLDDGLPVAVINHYLEELPVTCVAVNNRTAAVTVVEFLARLGHREIATITGDLKTQAGLDRLDGYVTAMNAKQLPVKEGYIRYGDFGLPSARAAMEALLGMPDRPTAVFVGSDEMALEAIHVAFAKGVRVPEDVSVVGFDDNPIAAHAKVPLTTVRQPLGEMGRRGLELLFQQVQGKRRQPTKVWLPTELIERQSCRQTWLER